MNEPNILLSRPADSSPEKRTERIDTPVTPEVKEHFTAVAVAFGYGSTAELNRRLIEDFLYGQLSAVRMAMRHKSVDGRNLG